LKTLILILLFPLMLSGQILSKKDIAPILLTTLSGAFDGTAEAIKFHYPKIDQKLNLNDAFWNPAVSWKNKYKNQDPAQGPAYFGSTTFLCWTTDGYHLMRMGRNISMMTAITIKLGDKQKWYVYIIQGIIYYVAYTTGFNISYELLKR
jgi:hypothetical protein